MDIFVSSFFLNIISFCCVVGNPNSSLKKTSGILMSNFSLCFSNKMIIKNFTIIFKKIYLHMHIKEKFLLPLYANVCISITPSPPLPLYILNGWSPEPSAFMFKKMICISEEESLQVWKYITLYQHSTQMS